MCRSAVHCIKEGEKQQIMENFNAPWLSSYGDRKFNLDYPDKSISDVVLQTSDEVPSYTALSYMGRKIDYKHLKDNI